MPELNREDIIKALEWCIQSEGCEYCEYNKGNIDVCSIRADALALIKQLTEENESLGIENEVQRLNLGNTRDDLNNAECDVARLKRENTALEREVERLKKADAVPRSEYDNLEMQFTELDIECERLEKVEENFHKAKTEVAREIFEEIEKRLEQVANNGYIGYLDALADLKKKYIVEKGE